MEIVCMCLNFQFVPAKRRSLFKDGIGLEQQVVGDICIALLVAIHTKVL
jgi:hypothetical protein